MNFSNLIQDSTCDCLAGSFVENLKKFAIKTNKSHLRDADFKSYWEKGARITESCEDICSLKGQSVNIASTDEELDYTLKVFKQLFPIAPTYKPHCTVISFKQDSGLVKHTPRTDNDLHYDFYKCDGFNLDMVNFHQTIPLEDV